MDEKYTITLTREQYIIVREAVKADLAKAFMDDDQIAVEGLQSAYQAITAAIKEATV